MMPIAVLGFVRIASRLGVRGGDVNGAVCEKPAPAAGVEGSRWRKVAT